MKETINRKDLARIISKRTGYTIIDVEEVLKAEEEVIADAISQGVDIKHHKLFKLEIETKKPKKAWDGFKKEYFYIGEKKAVKLKPLSMMLTAISELNEREEEEE